MRPEHGCYQGAGKRPQAAAGDIAAHQHLRIALALYDDRQRKTQEIQALERDIASRLVQTPRVLGVSQPRVSQLFKSGDVRDYILEAGKRDAVLLLLHKITH